MEEINEGIKKSKRFEAEIHEAEDDVHERIRTISSEVRLISILWLRAVPDRNVG